MISIKNAELQLYFSYGQFMIYDASLKLPGLAWTDSLSNQGFARQDSIVNVRTLQEFGLAPCHVYEGLYAPNPAYVRVLAVPFHSPSRAVSIEGPEEFDVDRELRLHQENFKLYIAQK